MDFKTFQAHYPRLSNVFILLVFLGLATAGSFLFHYASARTANISILYILSIVLIARFTTGYVPGIIACLVGVIGVNYLFTYPYFKINFTLSGYPVSFIGMLAISLITSTTTTHLKKQAQILAEREKLIVEAEKEKMRANLLRAVSHDLRTPLTSIIGASTTYLDNVTSLSEEEKYILIHNISDDSHWLLNMVENLLSVTRIHADVAKVTKSLESVEEVISEAVQRLKKRIPEARIKVKVPDELLLIPMDAILIEQVLINLFENALIHGKGELPIECIVEKGDKVIRFKVIDYGIGISPERLPYLFDGSSSSNQSSDVSKGIGIGLSICKTIITAHEGKIYGVNHSTGAEFAFELPMEEKSYDD